jgi:hypothetical protein
MDKHECGHSAHALGVLFAFGAVVILIGKCVINEFLPTDRFGYEEKLNIFNF